MRRGQPGRLSPLRLKQIAKRPGRHADGGNLYLSVTEGPNGPRASWVFMYNVDGKRHRMGLGSLSIVTLAMAREKAVAARRQLLDNVDPLNTKRQQRQDALAAAGKLLTFADCARRYHADHSPKWAASHCRAWLVNMQRHIFPALGNAPVKDVDLAAVIRSLEPVWAAMPGTASRLRAQIEAVLDYAKVSGWREGDNPAAWSLLSKRFPSARALRPVVHMAAMKWQEVPAFLRELRQRTEIAAAALEFGILAWARPKEYREARFDEIDFETATWTVPAGRMKGKREHRVPLSDTALAVLRRMAEIRQNEWVFPGLHGGPTSKDAVRKLMLRMGRGGYTRHGFRSAAADWRADATQFDAELQEACLAHALPNGTQAAYQRGTQFEKRRKVMDAWSGFLDGAEPRVAQLKAVS
jgi:integrase